MPNTSSSTPKHEATAARAALDAMARTLLDATVEVVWCQWSAVGGMASARRRAKSLVDPEALVLISLTLEPTEARLADLLGDWAVRNSDLLSVQRMQNLAERYPAATRERLAGFARLALEEGRDHRWKPLIAAGAPAPTYRRNKARARRAEPVEPAALMLRLRLAFGVGIKADLLSFLLATDQDAWAGISTIAAATEYTVAAVRKAARNLAEARFIEEMADTRAEYHAPREAWQALLGAAEMAPWRGWNERFVFVAAFLDWAAEARQRPLTPYVLESRGRELLETYAATFRWHRVWPRHPQTQTGIEPEALSAAIEALSGWMIREA